VDGVGVTKLPVPPVGVVYHNKLLPIAFNAEAVTPWQYVSGVITTGAKGSGFIVTVIADLGPSQIPIVELT
jgi:hypothetical protein